MINSLHALRALRGLLVSAICLLAAPLGALGAEQQGTGTAGPAAGAAAAPSGGLQEVVVTATRHEEALSKVPVSLTALTQDDLDQKGIKDMLDIVRFTPGVSIDVSATNAISIRGISSSGGAGTTGIYLDDTPIQMRSVGFNPDDTLPKTFDLERVEILRGPQGTLFGAGAEGGAVRYLFTQPRLTGTSTYMRSEVSYTQFGQPNFEVGIARGQPLIDGTLGVRASVWYRQDGGWINRIDPTTGATLENNINHTGTVAARIALLWQPFASFGITPSILYQNSKRHDDSTYWTSYSDAGSGRFNTATPERIPNDDQWYLPALKLQWDFASSQLISNTSYFHRNDITAYQGTVFDMSYYQTAGGYFAAGCQATGAPGTCPWFPLINGAGLHLPGAPGCVPDQVSCFTNYQTPNTMTNTQEIYTEELRWQSTAASAKLQWTVGVFWQLAKEGSIEELNDHQIIPFFQYLYGIDPTGPAYYGAFYSCPTNVNYPLIPACDVYYNNNKTYDRQIAGYGELSYAFTDWFRLTVGARVARTEFSLSHYSDGLENFGPSNKQANEQETPNTPKVTLAFQVDPNNLYYATYAKGFRVGGGNAPLPPFCATDLAAAGYPNGAPLTYKSDQTQNYEIGAKNNIGRTLRLATSLYYIKWNQIQQNIYVAGACGLQFTDNLGFADAWGGDLQAELSVGPMLFDLAAGYTSARYTQNSPGGCSAGAVPCKSSNGDAVSGQAAIDYAPGLNAPVTVAVGAEYRFRLAEHDSFVRADWQYAGANPWLSTLQNPNNLAQYNPFTYTLKETSFTSVRAGMRLAEWEISAFVDNLFDSHRVTSYALGQPAAVPTVQENDYIFRPRTFGITAVWHVGAGH